MIIPNGLGPIERTPMGVDETAAYMQRVLNDAGIIADARNLINSVNQQKIPNTMGANKYDSASFVLSANGGYKAGKLYALKPANGNADPPFTRNSAAWRRNGLGAFVQEAVDVPLAHYRAGETTPVIPFEPSSINHIRNPIMQGAVVGTPGTLPINWAQTMPSGWSRQIVAVTTIDGINYLQVRYFGTPATGAFYLYFGTTNGIAATVGQRFNVSVFATRTGTFPMGGFNLGIEERNASQVYLTEGGSQITMPSSLSRVNINRTIANANTAFIRPYMAFFNLNTSAAYDFTITIGWPQTEPFDYPTSPMPSNGSAAFTRAVSQLPVNALQAAGVFAANEGCVFLDLARMVANAAGTAPFAFRRADGTEVIRLEANGVANQYRVNLPTLSQASAYNAGTRIAVAWNGANVRISQGGSLIATFNGALGAVDQLRYTGNGLIEMREMLGYNAAPTTTDLNALTA